jgi:hypothetical protein
LGKDIGGESMLKANKYFNSFITSKNLKRVTMLVVWKHCKVCDQKYMNYRAKTGQIAREKRNIHKTV